MSDELKEFPILSDRDRDTNTETPYCSIPWSLIEPHRKRAEYNHCGQTLERLAQRGGLSPRETLVAIRDLPLGHVKFLNVTASYELLMKMAKELPPSPKDQAK